MSYKYRAYFSNGAIAEIMSDISPEDFTRDDNQDELFDELYDARPELCHHCAARFDVGDDSEIYSIVHIYGDGKHTDIFTEKTFAERLQDENSRLSREIRSLRAQLDTARGALTVSGVPDVSRTPDAGGTAPDTGHAE